MTDMIPREQADRMVREAVQLALAEFQTQSDPILKDVLDRYRQGAADAIRAVAPKMRGMDGAAAALKLADLLQGPSPSDAPDSLGGGK